MKKVFVLSLLSAMLMVPAAHASTVTGNLLVKANVIAGCTVNTSATGSVTDAVIDFGTISTLAGGATASTSSTGGAKVGVLCNNNTSYSMMADGGSNLSGTTQRRMKNTGAADYLPYDLYTDSGYSSAIGVGTTFLSGSGTGAEVMFDIYGKIPAGTTLPTVGAYLDTVTLTVTY